MSPPGAIARRMWIAVFIRKLMMNAMRGHPEDRPALHRQGTADRKKVFQPQRDFVGSMRMQSVITKADPQIDCYPVQKSGNCEVHPTELKECRDRPQVKQ